MRRREFITLLGGAAAWPLAARAQEPIIRQYRIGILETIPPGMNTANLTALYRGLREHGYIEGQNLTIEYRSADGRAERFPQFAADLVSRGVDVIVTRGTPAALAAKNAPGNTPVVMAAIGEPLGTGVVAELARPGTKVTGLSAFVNELAGKRVEFLHEMMPNIKRLAWLHNMLNPIAPPQWDETKKAAQTRGLDAQLLDIRSGDDLSRAFERATKEHIEGIIVSADGLIQANQQSIIRLAEDHRLPAIYQSREFVDAGGLVSLGVNYPALYYRAAIYLDKVLKGAKPADLPVEQPTKLEIILNLRTAKALGLEIPPTLLARADEVIE
jgi:putative ABC transport system substrate-binding protein